MPWAGLRFEHRSYRLINLFPFCQTVLLSLFCMRDLPESMLEGFVLCRNNFHSLFIAFCSLLVLNGSEARKFCSNRNKNSKDYPLSKCTHIILYIVLEIVTATVKCSILTTQLNLFLFINFWEIRHSQGWSVSCR